MVFMSLYQKIGEKQNFRKFCYGFNSISTKVIKSFGDANQHICIIYHIRNCELWIQYKFSLYLNNNIQLFLYHCCHVLWMHFTQTLSTSQSKVGDVYHKLKHSDYQKSYSTTCCGYQTWTNTITQLFLHCKTHTSTRRHPYLVKSDRSKHGHANFLVAAPASPRDKRDMHWPSTP